MKTVAILQARMGSTRLPGKMLLPLAGKPLVQHVIERVQRAKRLDDVILAIPIKDLDAFEPITKATNTWLYPFTGDENDLVARYLGAATMADADIVVRVPCDNPCVQGEYIDSAIHQYMDGIYTFFSNTTEWFYEHKSVDGVGAEVFSMSRLKWLDKKTEGQPEYREHPHKYFFDCRANDYDMPDHGIEFGHDPAHRRLDVNSMEDYLFVKDIYEALWPSNHNFTITDVLAYLERKKVMA